MAYLLADYGLRDLQLAHWMLHDLIINLIKIAVLVVAVGFLARSRPARAAWSRADRLLVREVKLDSVDLLVVIGVLTCIVGALWVYSGQ